MRRFFIIGVCLFGLVLRLKAQESASEVVARIAPSIVKLHCDETGIQGSGTIVSPDGLIFTNGHVVGNCTDLVVAVIDSTDDPVPQDRYRAKVLGTQQTPIDFAVLQIDRLFSGTPINTRELDLPYVVISEKPLVIAEPIYIFGYPESTNYTFFVDTVNEVKGIERSPNNTFPLAYWTLAQMGPGISGGLASNSKGELVGIPTEGVTTSSNNYNVVLHWKLIESTTESVLTPYIEKVVNNPEGVTVFTPGPPTVIPQGLDYSLPPQNEVIMTTTSTFPYTQRLIVGGDVSGDYLIGCNGFSQPEPNFRLQWHGGDLKIRFVADTVGMDTTLMVNQPNSIWKCNDDEDIQTKRDPLLILENAPAGIYDIYVGTYNADEEIPGVLIIEH